MSLEPQDAYTVLRHPLLPPKPEAKMRVPLSEAYYALLMAQDAVKVRKRHGTERVGHGTAEQCQDANERRHREAIAEREALASKALDIIAKRPRTAADLRELLHVSDNRMRAALGLLQSQGKVGWTRRDRFAFWEVR